MKIAVLDITGRNAIQYNPALCNAISRVEKDITLLSPTLSCTERGFKYVRLLNLLPKSWLNKTTKFKRLLRAFESIINYIYVWIYLLIKKPDILHFQWLPFLEFSSIEKYILKWYRFTCRGTRFYFTVHNIYPHNFNDVQKKKYRKRFLQIDSLITGYLVHLRSTEVELQREYKIRKEKIHVAYHGIYKAETPKIHSESPLDGRIRLILYGSQSNYKGTDIFIDALKEIPKSYLKKISVKIIGQTEKQLYDRCISDAHKLGVNWINNFVEDSELYQAIEESDLIILPYRNITQSGVLLLALSFVKPILTSDLQPFKETLEGYPDEYFFKTGNSKSLAKLIVRYINGEIDIEKQKTIIKKLNVKYSWDNTAISTLNAYNEIVSSYSML